MLKISKLSVVEPSEALTRLFCELTGREMIPDVDRVNRLIAAGELTFYAAYLEGSLVGMTSIISCRTALSDKYWVEDVAVLSDYRGKGYGRQLLSYVLEDVKACCGSGVFYLTSKPSRQAARQLYQSLGFIQYETGVFKMSF